MYTAMIDGGLTAMRKWIAENGIKELPSDPFELPKDCPLWEMNLSLAQAGGIVSALRREMAGGPVAQA